MNIHKFLAEGGGYNLPFLVHLYSPDETLHIHLINDNLDMVYDGDTYASSNFTYFPGDSGEAQLSIEIVEHDEIIDLLENNYYLKAEVVGIFNGEEVEEIGQWKHKYGDATWDGAKLELKLDKDDRGEMTFAAFKFTSNNNRGNT
ncbi:MAG: hypothetical protein IJQ86_06375 [Spirochaetia bacterium]|nr:hypothetical protein [Spirochaetia bacterium]